MKTDFLTHCVAVGLPKPVREFSFATEKKRRWRFDWLFPGKLAVEIQGGNWVGGRHSRPAALTGEYEKLNAAVELGYSVLFYTPEQVDSGYCFVEIKRILKARESQP